MKALLLNRVSLQYNGRTIIGGLDWQIDAGSICSIIGPNGCGKSTLLKAIARQLKPEQGSVVLEGRPLAGFAPRELARHLAMLPQSRDKVPDMTVRRLVGYGRFPHKPVWAPMRREDEEVVDWALSATGTEPFAGRKLSALSGGERQRVWIAMALAQQPRVLLLDEPTTYLDVSHQLEIMELVSDINRLHGVTIVMVLHDINHAAAFSDEIAVMRKGALYAHGKPEDTITEATLADVFGVKARIERDPGSGRPVCLITGLLGRTGKSRRPSDCAEEPTAVESAADADAEG